MIIFQRAFWNYATERAIKAVAQTAAATLIAGEVVGLFAANWLEVLSISAMAGVLSLLTSVGSTESRELSEEKQGKRRAE